MSVGPCKSWFIYRTEVGVYRNLGAVADESIDVQAAVTLILANTGLEIGVIKVGIHWRDRFTLNFSEALPEAESNTGTAEPVSVDLPFKDAKAKVIEHFEREYLGALLERHGGNLSAASRAAELDRKHLRELLRKYQMRGND